MKNKAEECKKLQTISLRYSIAKSTLIIPLTIINSENFSYVHPSFEFTTVHL